MSSGALATAAISPMSKFIGDWEGTVESLAGNYQLAKRMSWLVQDSWLLEQVVVVDLQQGSEAARNATLYAFNSGSGRLEATHLFSEGQRGTVAVELREGGFTREMRPLGRDGVVTLTQTTKWTEREWHTRTLMLDENGEWQEVERSFLERKTKKARNF